MKAQLISAACLLIGSQTALSAKEFSFSPTQAFEGAKGEYIVTKDEVNVREAADPNAAKTYSLEKREIVTVLGKAPKTSWFAVKKGNKELGFIYQNALTPIIDAKIVTPLSGDIVVKNEQAYNCEYILQYGGHAVEEEVVFMSSDYLLHVDCVQSGNNDTFSFDAMLFVSEVPIDLGLKPIYQITLTLPDVAVGYEDFLFSTVLYNRNKKTVELDIPADKSFLSAKAINEKPAETVKDAIINALSIQLSSFNQKAWNGIRGEELTPPPPNE